MAPPAPPIPGNQGDACRPKEPSTIYKLIMTPLLFTSFLFSLLLVDLRHSALRAHYHPEQQHQEHPQHEAQRGGRRLPAWLHHTIFHRYRRYQYVVVDEHGRPIPAASPSSMLGAAGFGGGFGNGMGGGETPTVSPGSPGSVGQGGEDYYHSKQRKLMKMEAAEAFEMRGVVMAALAGCVVVGGGSFRGL